MKAHVHVFFLTGVILLTACAGGPQVNTRQAPGVDFARYTTFSFMEELGTDRAGYESLVSQQLKLSTRRELELRGLRFVEDPGAADLLVNFHAHLDEGIRARRVTDPWIGSTYWNYRRGFYRPWPDYATYSVAEKYSQGTLTIDLVDASEQVMVWEGIARNQVTERVLRDVASALDAAVVKIFEDFPMPARSGGY